MVNSGSSDSGRDSLSSSSSKSSSSRSSSRRSRQSEPLRDRDVEAECADGEIVEGSEPQPPEDLPGPVLEELEIEDAEGSEPQPPEDLPGPVLEEREIEDAECAAESHLGFVPPPGPSSLQGAFDWPRRYADQMVSDPKCLQSLCQLIQQGVRFEIHDSFAGMGTGSVTFKQALTALVQSANEELRKQGQGRLSRNSTYSKYSIVFKAFGVQTGVPAS